MPRRSVLPPELTGSPVTPADLASAGVSPKVLRGKNFTPVWRGLYVPADWDPSLVDRCAALHRVLPSDAVFFGITAAQIRGLPVPWRRADELHVAVPEDCDPPERTGVIAHHVLLPVGHLETHDSLPVTSVARTTLDLASVTQLHELVATLDHALRLGLVDDWCLASMRHWGVGRRGVKAFRQAIQLADGRAESAPESAVRVWCQLAGLPQLEPNVEVFVGRELVARVDLLAQRYRVVVEYEGAYHRDRDQFARDIARRARLTSAGYEVVQIEASMMHRPREVVALVEAALRRGGWDGLRTTTAARWE